MIQQVELVATTSTELEIAIKLWQTNLKANKKSIATCQQYKKHIEKLRQWLSERGITGLKPVKRIILEEWVAELHQEWAPATVKQAVSAARSFFKWCEDYDTISKKRLRKLLKGLRVPKVPKNPQRTLSISEVKQLLAICDLGTPKGQRDTAMIGILMDTGLRASEICKLTVDQIKFDAEPFPGVIVNQLSSVTVKGGKEGTGHFGQQTKEHLLLWLKTREKISKNIPNIFFSLPRGKLSQPFDRHTLKKMLRDLGNSANIKGVSPHAFRRAFACTLEMAGASSREVMEIGRWENLEMVLLYTRDYKATMQYNRFAPMDYINSI